MASAYIICANHLAIRDGCFDNAMELSRLPAVWEEVRDDAALGDSDVRVYPYEATPPAGVPTAAFFAPGVDVVGEEARSLSSSQWIDANAHVNQPRILVHIAGDEEIIVAKLRHELEHVVQWLSVPDGHDLFTIYDSVLVAFGSFVGADARGSGVLYNVVPFEADANAAAYALTRKLLSVSDIERLARSEHGVLFRRGPWDPDVRSVAQRLRRVVGSGAIGRVSASARQCESALWIRHW